MASQWNVVTREGNRINGISEADVRDLLYRHKLHPEDWAAPVGDDNFKQIVLHDPFSSTAGTGVGRRRKAQEADQEMDMTPMIDVVFLLLIFFMITATFHLQTGMNFPPDKKDKDSTPSAQVPGLKEFDDRIIVEISETDQFFVKQAQGQNGPVGAEELVGAIRSEGEASNLNKVFVVAHEMSSLEAIVKAFDAAAEVGISEIALADVTTQRTSAASGPITIQRN
jgi:biopolymer transport protein ExbD